MYSENLKKLRAELDWSVDKLSKKIDIPSSTLWGYEGGKRVPSIELCIKLYKILKVNINWFLTGEGEMFVTEKKDFAGVEFEVEDARKLAQRLNDIELRMKKIEENS